MLLEMELPCPVTFLSPRVLHLLNTAVGDQCTAQGQQVLSQEKTINWPHLARLLPVEEDSDEYFLECVHLLSPFVGILYKEMEEWTEVDFTRIFGPYLDWTKECEMMAECFQGLKLGDSHILHGFLMTTSLLERSLGNLYLLRGKHCPSLLKDLLVTRQLEDILGSTTMQLLRILIGSPNSFNIRNIVWHGFPKPGELPPHLLCLLLCVIASIGQILQENKIMHDTVPARPYITFPHADLLDDPIPEWLTSENGKVLQKIFEESEFIFPAILPVWQLALQMAQRNRFGNMCVLLLPQLELGLRRVFITINKCPARLITAESTELFTTFEEIFQIQLPDGSENKLRQVLGTGLMNLLFDTLMYPEGPRIRDKISHGETSLPAFPCRLALHVLYISTGLCIKFLPPEDELCDDPVVANIRRTCDEYESRFHPVSLLRRKICECCAVLGNWLALPRPPHQLIGTEVDWIKEGEVKEMRMYHSTTAILDSWKMPGELARDVHPFMSMTFLEKTLDTTPALTTLYRGNIKGNTTANNSNATDSQGSEGELVRILRRVTGKVAEICHQIQRVTHSRFKQWEEKQLRSRQRNTYRHMLDSIPLISQELRVIVILACCDLLNLEKYSEWIPAKQIKHIKFLKACLQYVENLYSYTSLDHNRWDDAVKVTLKFNERILGHYTQPSTTTSSA